MNTLKTINVNKFISLISLFLISIFLLGGCTPSAPPDTVGNSDQVINEEKAEKNTPPEEIAEQETPVVKITPTFLPEPEEINLEVFLRDIMQIEVSDKEIQNKFLKGEYGPVNWEILKVGTIKIPEEERERELYSVQHWEIGNFGIMFATHLSDLRVGYIKNGTFAYFSNASYHNKLNYLPLTEYSHPIEKYFLNMVSNKLKTINFPNSHHKLVATERIMMKGPMFCHFDSYQSDLDFSGKPSFSFSVNQDLSVWKLSNYRYFAKDQLNTCTIYEMRYGYVLEKDYGFERLNVELENKNISEKWYTPILFGCGGYQVPHYILGDHEIVSYLKKVGATSTGEKVFILSKNTPLPETKDQKGVFSGLNIYYFEPMDKISTPEDEKRSWRKFLQSQEKFYPVLFIEDTFGNYLIYKNKEFRVIRGC